MRWPKRWSGRLALAVAAAAATPAIAQDPPDVPPAISPLRVESDHNDINLVSGRTSVAPPVLSVPGAPHLRFDRVQNAAPHIKGTVNPAGSGYSTASFSVHHGMGGSESFRCVDFDCSSVTGSGSTLIQNSRTYRQAGTGAVWHFDVYHVDAAGPPRVILYYASSVSYPTGESLSYAYETAYLPGDPFNRPFRRPVTVTSNLGYHIAVSYHPGELGTQGWNAPAEATLRDSSNAVLGRMVYSLDGTSITQYGEGNQNPRTFACTGCVNSLGSDIEVWAGSMQLPTEGAPTLQVATSASGNVVGSVARDGVGWSYSYLNLRHPTLQSGLTDYGTYIYDRLTVTGPNGFNQAYHMAQIGPPGHVRNVMTGTTDSIGRTSTFAFDEAYRPTRVTYPEGNQIEVGYDEWGNVSWRRTRAKPGTGLADIFEQAYFPADTCYGGGPQVLCYRPLWSRDGLNRQTDYAYNGSGQLTERTEPADANGVRRRTIIEYAAAPNGVSRRSVVRVCGVGTTCGTNQEIRTEYYYGSHALLPTLERRWNLATGAYLDTTYGYDAAGRLTSTDGPLAGTADATYNRYDEHGRKIWEIGAAAPNGVRIARRHTYRNSDDKPTATEIGTIPDENSWALTVQTRTDVTYDSRRYAIRQALSSAGTTYTVADQAHDDQGRLVCIAVRMNPAAFGQAPGACAHSTAGGNGPDRITYNVYDAAGQHLQEIRAYLTGSQQNYASYIYTLNGRRTYQTDANGNTSAFQYDGHDRLWITYFPTLNQNWVNWSDYEVYGYDAVGNRISLRKRDGSTLTFQYDNLNRMTLKIVPERAGLSSTHTRDVHYGYDLRNLQTYARFDSPSGEGMTNAWDAFGRLTSSTLLMDGASRQLGYEYDAGGRRTRITHPDLRSFVYAYDGRSRNSLISDGADMATLAQPVWNDNDTPYGLWRPTGVTYYGQDPIGRLSALSHDVGGSGHDVAFTFARNPASQITQRTRSNDVFAWGGAYNVSRNYSVNGLNQYTAAGSATFGYDANGNLVSDGSNAFTYDVENRLVAASGAVSASLRYDPLGRLYEVTGGSGTTRFLYDGDALVAEYNTSGTLLRRYVHGNAAGADDPLVWFESNARRDLHADHQGTMIAVTDPWGNALAVNSFDEWGIPGAANQGRFQYTGQAWLAELGMYHYKARVYSPTLGRFLQTDPVGYDDQVNLYAYVGNDPVNHTDPDGRQAQALAAPLLCAGPQAVGCGLIGAGIGIATCAASSGCRGAVERGLRSPLGATAACVLGNCGYMAQALLNGRTPEFTDIPGRPPFQGEPDSTVRGPWGSRTYGPDGYPQTDRDGPHPDHRPPNNDDHVHDWTRPADGGPPVAPGQRNNPYRGSARRPGAGDPPRPRGNSPSTQTSNRSQLCTGSRIERPGPCPH